MTTAMKTTGAPLPSFPEHLVLRAKSGRLRTCHPLAEYSMHTIVRNHAPLYYFFYAYFSRHHMPLLKKN